MQNLTPSFHLPRIPGEGPGRRRADSGEGGVPAWGVDGKLTEEHAASCTSTRSKVPYLLGPPSEDVPGPPKEGGRGMSPYPKEKGEPGSMLPGSSAKGFEGL